MQGTVLSRPDSAPSPLVFVGETMPQGARRGRHARVDGHPSTVHPTRACRIVHRSRCTPGGALLRRVSPCCACWDAPLRRVSPAVQAGSNSAQSLPGCAWRCLLCAEWVPAVLRKGACSAQRGAGYPGVHPVPATVGADQQCCIASLLPSLGYTSTAPGRLTALVNGASTCVQRDTIVRLNSSGSGGWTGLGGTARRRSVTVGRRDDAQKLDTR